MRLLRRVLGACFLIKKCNFAHTYNKKSEEHETFGIVDIHWRYDRDEDES